MIWKKGTFWGIAVLLLFGAAVAEINMSPSPIWQSAYGVYPTGVAWADIDGNGWHDLVLGNGLDVTYSPNHVYFNDGGTLALSPGWVSDDEDPSDNVCIGDFDSDGDPDIVIAQLGCTAAGCPPLPHVMYLNDGGSLSTSPDWESQDGNAFSCALADPDLDGDLDIAIAQGDWLTGHLEKTVIYFNEGGTFDSLPGWESDSSYYSPEIEFADIDSDGDQDMAIGDRGSGIYVFYNHDGAIETSPSWQTTEVFVGRQMDFGDVDLDGDLDLAVAEGTGEYNLFLNTGGSLETSPCWNVSASVEPSCVCWADVDHDGDPDLAAGAWSGASGIFENQGGTLDSAFAWVFYSGGYKQQFAFCDFDEDSLIDTTFVFNGDGERQLFYIDINPLHEISSVEIDGVPLALDEYCYELARSWVSLATAPAVGEILTVRYTASADLDLAVTGTSRVMLFENLTVSAVEEDPWEEPEVGKRLDLGATILKGPLRLPDDMEAQVYDIAGKKISPDHIEPGIYFVEIDGRIAGKVVKVQ
jgi:hypothetical protein